MSPIIPENRTVKNRLVKNPTPVWRSLIVGLLVALLAGCGINNIPTYDEAAKAAWADVQNQYQRRADLVPNLVETVKGYAAHESETLQAVVEARAKVGSMQMSGDMLSDPTKMKAFEENQAQLTGALSRLLVVVEKYPDLKANQNFLALQSQLEGTENRIAVARRDYIGAVQRYNTELRTFPGLIWYKVMYGDMQPRATFEAPAGTATAPAVEF